MFGCDAIILHAHRCCAKKAQMSHVRSSQQQIQAHHLHHVRKMLMPSLLVLIGACGVVSFALQQIER